MNSKGTEMLSEASLNIAAPTPIVEFNVPMYIFQYLRKSSTITVAVPPIQIPNNMKNMGKNVFYGPQKSLFFDLITPQSDNFVTKWIEKSADDLEISTQIAQVNNLLDDPKSLRETFFTSKKLMIETLKINKKNWTKVNERLTNVFSD